ncbi:Hypothetical protein Minf_2096 [Methylacidiphilum infernorum V4]|uniref:Uncharacterized protein n=1 Tax=Methylacidiphilum infernorum (isolate V4) TaxID=481448 RepID=B3DZ58_METI4|nr:Hypothetical protein Minf_2096 [Methylacidiphilum infernorum V4]
MNFSFVVFLTDQGAGLSRRFSRDNPLAGSKKRFINFFLIFLSPFLSSFLSFFYLSFVQKESYAEKDFLKGLSRPLSRLK